METAIAILNETRFYWLPVLAVCSLAGLIYTIVDLFRGIDGEMWE